LFIIITCGFFQYAEPGTMTLAHYAPLPPALIGISTGTAAVMLTKVCLYCSHTSLLASEMNNEL